MNDLNLSAREQIIFDTFRKNRNRASAELLMSELKKNKDKLRGGTRALSVSVRYLGFKVAPRGWFIERTSNLGRGNLGEYRLHMPRRNGSKR